jgi:hypothetical protein
LETVFSAVVRAEEGQLEQELRVGTEPLFRDDLSTEAEPLLEAVTGKRLMKSLRTGKDLMCALVVCKVWKLAMVL